MRRLRSKSDGLRPSATVKVMASSKSRLYWQMASFMWLRVRVRLLRSTPAMAISVGMSRSRDLFRAVLATTRAVCISAVPMAQLCSCPQTTAQSFGKRPCQARSWRHQRSPMIGLSFKPTTESCLALRPVLKSPLGPIRATFLSSLFVVHPHHCLSVTMLLQGSLTERWWRSTSIRAIPPGNLE